MLTDTHAHLDYPDFEHDLPAILERANAAGVTRILSIGTSLESSRRAVALAERHQALALALADTVLDRSVSVAVTEML